MTAVYCIGNLSLAPAQTGRTASLPGNVGVGAVRLPTDPLFFAALTLRSIVVGSRYRVTRADTGAELATGVASVSPTVLTGIPCFANPMQVNITVRNASGTPAYRIFDTAALLTKTGADSFILQQLDE
jgi:hypothetical protein